MFQHRNIPPFIIYNVKKKNSKKRTLESLTNPTSVFANLSGDSGTERQVKNRVEPGHKTGLEHNTVLSERNLLGNQGMN